ncbi:MAG: hypothetical protein QG597_1767 [Actinomycetota bacterium]|jgi:hypothetical protein|nr:hypothetical protein [Actinomycetota bacterium]
MSRNPTAWRQYRRLVSAGTLTENSGLNRFAARFSMAHQLTDVSFTNLRPEVAKGYTEGLRVALGYSALESLEAALKGQLDATSVSSVDLAGRFRHDRAGRLRLLLLENLTNKSLLGRIERLYGNPDEADVRCVAQGLRHLVFHGIFTPHGAGFDRSIQIRTFVSDLAVAMLSATDARFTQWVATHGPPLQRKP